MRCKLGQKACINNATRFWRFFGARGVVRSDFLREVARGGSYLRSQGRSPTTTDFERHCKPGSFFADRAIALGRDARTMMRHESQCQSRTARATTHACKRNRAVRPPPPRTNQPPSKRLPLFPEHMNIVVCCGISQVQ